MATTMLLTEDEFRLLTWSRPGLSQMTIQPQSLQRQCPLDNCQRQLRFNSEAQHTAFVSNIGHLMILPLEIIQSIFSILDLQSLTLFRVVSWHSRGLVDNFSPYNAIVQHYPDALCALLSTQMAVHHTIRDIFEALCTQDCFECGEFGPFLDMFTGHRCCITCVIRSDNLLSITASSAKRELGLNSKTMRTLPTLLSIPGQYTEREKMYRKRVSLVRVLSATAAGSIQHEDSYALRRRSGSLGKILRQPPQLTTIPRPLLQRFDGHGQNPYRFMAMVRFPTLDPKTGDLDWGVSCQACRLGPRDEKRGYHNWNTVYSAAGYMEHFQKCQVSQMGRKVVPKYLTPTDGDLCRSNARFLGFLSNFKFETMDLEDSTQDES